MGVPIKLRVASSEEPIRLSALGGNITIDAFSPKVAFERVEGGTRLDITDINGTKSVVIPDGTIGEDGVGIKSVSVTQNGELVVVLTDDTTFVSDPIRPYTFDEVPTTGSNNPVKSNGIKLLIDAIASTIPRRVSDLTDDSGHYTKPDGGIPASDLASGVIPDITGKQDLLLFDSTPTLQSANPVSSNGIKRAIDTVYNQLSGETDIKLLAKANRVDECTEGNFAALDENGNLVDSGSKASDFVTEQALTNALSGKQNTLTFDNVPTASSDNPVKSGGIKSAIDAVANTIPTNVSELTNDAGYITENDKIDIEQLTGSFTPVELGYVYPERFVYANNGNTNRNTDYNATDYIDLSGVSKIRYKRTKTTSSTSNAGMAFYNASKGYLDGIFTERAKDSIGYYETREVTVPDGAKYARFTMLADTETYGEFELYALREGMGLLEQKADKTETAIITNTNPVIIGEDNHRYVCGTVDTLTLTPPSSGIVDVIFTSGTTPTVLSVPNTVKWPGWFDPTSLDASTTYEINIMDGVYGAVMAWT